MTEIEARIAECHVIEQRINYLIRTRRSPDYIRAIADAMEVVSGARKNLEDLKQ